MRGGENIQNGIQERKNDAGTNKQKSILFLFLEGG
jgi:hypothetical protein